MFIARQCLDVTDQEWVYFGFTSGGTEGWGSPSPGEHPWDNQMIPGLLQNKLSCSSSSPNPGIITVCGAT